MLISALKQHWRPTLGASVRLIRSNPVLAGAVLAAVLAVSVSEYAGPANRTAQKEQGLTTLRQLLRDPLAYLLQRSPGVRDSVGLLQTKQRAGSSARSNRSAHGARKPHERVLANVRYAPPGGDWSPPDISAPLFAGSGLPGLDLHNPAIAGTDSPLAAASPAGPAGSASPGFLETVPKTPTAAVPEPSTWSAMLWGMALTGAALRGPWRRTKGTAVPRRARS